MRQIGFVLAVPLLLVLSGCAGDPQAEALNECQRIAPRAVLDSTGGEYYEDPAEFTDVKVEQRGDSDAWDIAGSVTLTLDSGETVTNEWRCFAQKDRGKLYASINDVH